MRNIEHLISKKGRELKIEDFLNLPDLNRKVQALCVENFFEIQKLLYEVAMLEKDVYISNFSTKKNLCKNLNDYVATLNVLANLQLEIYQKMIKTFGKIHYLPREKEEISTEEVKELYSRYGTFSDLIYDFENKILSEKGLKDLDLLVSFLEKEFNYKMDVDPSSENYPVLEVILRRYGDNLKIISNILFHMKQSLYSELRNLEKEFSKSYLLDVPFELEFLDHETLFKKYYKKKKSLEYVTLNSLYEKLEQFERRFDELLDESIKRYEEFFRDPDYDLKHKEKQIKFGVLREIKETLNWYKLENEYTKRRKNVLK